MLASGETMGSTSRHRRRFIRDQRTGTALLELAVAIPVLLLFTMGVVDFARVYFASITVANAAMAGAIQLSLPPGVMREPLLLIALLPLVFADVPLRA